MRSESISPPNGFPSWLTFPAFVFVPYIAVWLMIFLITFPGRKYFGIALYCFVPLTFILLFGVVVACGVYYADATNQLSVYRSRFYSMFTSTIPVGQYARDKYRVQPLRWGLLSSFVHLSQAFNLWTGVFPMLVKWNGGSYGVRKHVAWIPTLLGFGLVVQLPVILVLFAMSSTYDISYARCHLGVDWEAPFIIMPHMFSKFSTHRLLTACYFFALLLSLFLSAGLLLLTTVSNIRDFILLSTVRQDQRSRRKVYRIIVLTVCPLLALLGLPMITRSGFYWIRLVDAFVDRLLIVVMVLQAVGFLMAYSRSPGERWEKETTKIIVNVAYGILFALAAAVYMWYAAALAQPSPDSGCRTFSRAPENDPLRNRSQILGWFIAGGPLVLGVILELLNAFRISKTNKHNFCETFLHGIAYIDNKYPSPVQPICSTEAEHSWSNLFDDTYYSRVLRPRAASMSAAYLPLMQMPSRSMNETLYLTNRGQMKRPSNVETFEWTR